MGNVDQFGGEIGSSKTSLFRSPTQLNTRERLLLQCVVHNYILTATPVGSRMLTRRYSIDLSPASVRNTLADLEEMGLLTHTHTSAGRIPTDLGYRIYVDHLMHSDDLSEDIILTMKKSIESISAEVNSIYNKTSEILSEVSRMLAVIIAPDLSSGILDKVELVRVSSERIMIVIVVKSGLVRSIILEMNSTITDEEIADASQFINQRLQGMRINDIYVDITQRLSGGRRSRNAIVRLFMDFPERIFSIEPKSAMHIGTARPVLEQPEYRTPEKVRGIIELVEDHDIIVHLLKSRKEGVSVTIGQENEREQLRDFSVITSTYRTGESKGTIGIIGPTRMNYSYLVALVDYTSRLVSEKANKS